MTFPVVVTVFTIERYGEVRIVETLHRVVLEKNSGVDAMNNITWREIDFDDDNSTLTEGLMTKIVILVKSQQSE